MKKNLVSQQHPISQIKINNSIDLDDSNGPMFVNQSLDIKASK